MGNVNCLNGDKVAAQDHEKQEPAAKEAVEMEGTRSLSQSKLEPAPAMHVDGGKKKMVRFKLCDEGESGGGGGDSKGGVVRIRVAVTQRELQQLLNYRQGSKFSSVEQLLSAMKLRSRRRISEGRTSDGGGINGSWRPALESIPEDH